MTTDRSLYLPVLLVKEGGWLASDEWVYFQLRQLRNSLSDHPFHLLAVVWVLGLGGIIEGAE